MCNLKEPLLVATERGEEPHVIMARTDNKDGSVSLKVTTSTTHPNGYTDVKVELFEVPESMSSAVDEELGVIPKEYLNRVEYRVLPPGALEEDDADDNTIYTHMTQRKDCDASTVRVSNLSKRRCPEWKRIIFGSVILLVAWVLTAALITDLTRERENALHSPEEASRSSAADIPAANETILPESNTTSTVTTDDTDTNTTGLLHTDRYFAPVTISHLLGANQRQYHLGVRGKSRI